MKTNLLLFGLVVIAGACTADGPTNDVIKEKSAHPVESVGDTTLTFVRNHEIVVCDVQQAAIAGVYELVAASAGTFGASFGVTFIFAVHATSGERINLVSGSPVAVLRGE